MLNAIAILNYFPVVLPDFLSEEKHQWNKRIDECIELTESLDISAYKKAIFSSILKPDFTKNCVGNTASTEGQLNDTYGKNGLICTYR